MNQSQSQIVLRNLIKFKNYEFIVTAYNSIGNGPASTPVTVYVGEAGRETYMYRHFISFEQQKYTNQNLSHVARKPVFGGLRPGKTNWPTQLQRLAS